MTPGRLWWLLRRDLTRGLAATIGDYFLRPRIWSWRNPFTGAKQETIAVHSLCGNEQLDLCAWMLASWTLHTQRNWPIHLHDDGTLPPNTRARLSALGLQVQVHKRTEADQLARSHLASRPGCAAYRDRHPLALKIFDIPALAGERFLLLDSDLLFFARPVEMLAWVDRPDDNSCWFNADVTESSNVDAAEANRLLHTALWPRVNSGLCLLTRQALDPDFCEAILTKTNIAAGHIWRVEQTLFALCASRYGRGGLLPPDYELSLGRSAAAGAVARHYVGAVRHRFWGEGVWRARDQLKI
jgi:hypothetical protein